MLDVLHLCCNCLDSCFVFIMLCAFMRVYFCSAFTYFCRAYLCSPPLSGFSTRLRALLELFTTSSCAASTWSFFFHRLCAAFVRSFISRSRTWYSNNCDPLDYVCVHWVYLLRDSALLLTLFVYRIARTLRETLVFTRSCLSPWPSKSFTCSEALLFMLSPFLLSPWFSGDLFLPERFHLSFCAFCVAPGLLEASFLPEHYCLRFCDFILALSLWGASFIMECSRLCFCDFNLAPSLWGAPFLLELSHLRFRDFNLAPSLWGALFLLGHSCLHFCDST
jgi:hypothetical protein